jgi:hypothetical protein
LDGAREDEISCRVARIPRIHPSVSTDPESAMNRILVALVAPLAFAPSAFAGDGYLDPQENVLVARNDLGLPATGSSYGAAISGSGRYVAFMSAADNLALGDGTGFADVFLHDLKKGTTTLISKAPSGAPGNNFSDYPSVSKKGRFVAFRSRASDLVVGDSNGTYDIFVHDTKSASTTRVSVGVAGAEANNSSQPPKISGNGRYVAFASIASNLVANDGNGKLDVFVHDRQTGLTERVSVATGGGESNNTSATPAISDNGRYVAFWSNATNLDLSTLSGVFVRDRTLGTTTRVSLSSSGIPHGLTYSDSLSISGDGKLVTFAGAGAGTTLDDSSPVWDVFVRDVAKGTTELVSLGENASVANADCIEHAISGNGRYVFFASSSTSLVASDNTAFKDVFVRDRKKLTTKRATLTMAGTAPSTDTYLDGVSHDGKSFVFESPATNLLATPTTGLQSFARRW